MKKRFFLFGAVAALAMGGALTACSDDAIDEGNNKVAEVDQTRYLHVTIANPPSGSRAEAGDFQDGTADENYVQYLHFVFYDAKGNPTGTPVTFSYEASNDNGNDKGFSDSTTETGYPNTGKIWSNVVGIDLKEGENLPSFVNVFINPINFTELSNKTLTQLDEEVRQVARNKGYFPMSNAVCYTDNPITGEKMVRMTATPITSGSLFNTPEEAQTSPSLEVFVERYASKVEVSFDADATINDASIDPSTATSADGATPRISAVKGYKLKFVPEYWRVNAVDRSSYVVKRFGVVDPSTGEKTFKPTYTQLNDILSPTTTTTTTTTWWNDPANHRSYWAASPAYYANSYPRVSDNITDKTVVESIDGVDRTKDYELYYFSYKQIADPSSVTATVPPSIKYNSSTLKFEGAFYARETTVAANVWGYKASEKSYSPLATMPSAVIIGHYDVTTDDGTAVKDTDGDGFWLFGKTGSQWNLFENADAVKTEMSVLQSVVMKKISTSDKAVDEYVAVKIGNGQNDVNVGVFTIEHPSELVREKAKKTVAGRLEALQLDIDYINKNNIQLYWYNPQIGNAGDYELITAENINAVNAALLTAGYATHYGVMKDENGTVTSGLAYFSIPIEHLGLYNSNTAGNYKGGVKNPNGTYNFSACPPGSFGLVRNHVYNIKISKIEGLATALRDGDQPIVPPVDEVSYFIGAKINILNWRIVPTQTVTL